MHKFDESIDELLFLGIGFMVSKIIRYSTVTDLAKFLGWSMSVPLKRATS